jgi:hypothetical protein
MNVTFFACGIAAICRSGLWAAEPVVPIPQLAQPDQWTSARDTQRLGRENHNGHFTAVDELRLGKGRSRMEHHDVR